MSEKRFKIEEVNGKFVVMVERSIKVDIKKPFWKFWGPTQEVKPVFEVHFKKNGDMAIYDNRGVAKNTIGLMGGVLCS